MSKVCCACLEEDEFSNSLSYSCGTCRDGYICFGCILEVDPAVSHKIKCPCCRTLNWKYYYRNMICSLESGDVNDRVPPAIALFLKNQLL